MPTLSDEELSAAIDHLQDHMTITVTGYANGDTYLVATWDDEVMIDKYLTGVYKVPKPRPEPYPSAIIRS